MSAILHHDTSRVTASRITTSPGVLHGCIGHCLTFTRKPHEPKKEPHRWATMSGSVPTAGGSPSSSRAFNTSTTGTHPRGSPVLPTAANANTVPAPPHITCTHMQLRVSQPAAARVRQSAVSSSSSSNSSNTAHIQRHGIGCGRSCVRACQRACQCACVSACLCACMPCLRAMPACVPVCHACVRVCVPSCLRACLPAKCPTQILTRHKHSPRHSRVHRTRSRWRTTHPSPQPQPECMEPAKALQQASFSFSNARPVRGPERNTDNRRIGQATPAATPTTLAGTPTTAPTTPPTQPPRIQRQRTCAPVPTLSCTAAVGSVSTGTQRFEATTRSALHDDRGTVRKIGDTILHTAPSCHNQP